MAYPKAQIKEKIELLSPRYTKENFYRETTRHNYEFIDVTFSGKNNYQATHVDIDGVVIWQKNVSKTRCIDLINGLFGK